MKKNERRKMTIITIIGIIGIIYAGAMTNKAKKEKEALEYTLEEWIPAQNETFWRVWDETYPNQIGWDEAVYQFKKDNGLEKYELIAGETYLVREYK